MKMGLRDHEGRAQEGTLRLLDRRSMVLCTHRVYGFKFLGILASPNMRAEGAQLAHPPHRILRH